MKISSDFFPLYNYLEQNFKHYFIKKSVFSDVFMIVHLVFIIIIPTFISCRFLYVNLLKKRGSLKEACKKVTSDMTFDIVRHFFSLFAGNFKKYFIFCRKKIPKQ